MAETQLEVLERIEQSALEALGGVGDEEGLQRWKVAHLGRSSPLMGDLRPAGQAAQGGAPGDRAARQRGQAPPGSRPGRAQRRRCARRPCSARWRPSGWTSPCRGARRRAAGCTPPPRPCARSTASSPRWASRSTARARWRPTSTTSSCSTSRPTTRRARCRIRSTSTPAGRAAITRCCCARTPRRGRSAPCASTPR